MTRYKVPRIAFINKCDRTGANPERVVAQLREKLNHNAVMLQIPIGLETDLAGVVDLVTMKAMYFDGDNGEDIRIEEIPANLAADAARKREVMLDAVSMFSDELMEAMLEGTPDRGADPRGGAPRHALAQADPGARRLGLQEQGRPAAARRRRLLPAEPGPERQRRPRPARQRGRGQAQRRTPSDPLVALAFKLEDGRYGQLTYVRIYQGKLAKGDTIVNSRTGRKVKVGRLVRMHADEMEDIESAASGDIVALFGIDCASGDTFTAPEISVSMTSMYVPAPVISLAVVPRNHKAQDNMSKALNRFSKEDPTFRVHADPETNETIISGMGELHLEVYLERMRREYAAEVDAGKPQVAYRETITRRAEFNYTHKKQTGGSGQYGRVAGFIEPLEEGGEYEFVNKVTGGAIPSEFIGSIDKGFKQCLRKGPLAGFPINGVRVTINDGASHSVDSSDNAFQQAGIGAFRDGFGKAAPVLLEPIMKVVVEGPTEFQGNIMGGLNQRRGIIIGTFEEGAFTVVEAEVPLADMFGYSTVLRSGTQGKAEFTMEFASYRQLPKSLMDEVIKEAGERKKTSVA